MIWGIDIVTDKMMLRKQQFDDLVDLVCPFYHLQDKTPGYYMRRSSLNPEIRPQLEQIFGDLARRADCRSEDVAAAMLKVFTNTSELTISDLTDNEPFLYWCVRIAKSIRDGRIGLSRYAWLH